MNRVYKILFNGLILGIGISLSWVAFTLEPHNNDSLVKLWQILFVSTGGSAMSVGLTGIISNCLNYSELTNIKDLIADFQRARISTREEDINNLRQSIRGEYYRYYKTYDVEREVFIWRVIKLSFSLSDDERRILSSFKYERKKARKKYRYKLEMALIQNHFLSIIEEEDNGDDITIEIYPFSRNVESIYAGLSIRKSWNRNTKQLVVPCMLSVEELIEGLSVSASSDDNIQIIEKKEDMDSLEKTWKEIIDGVVDLEMPITEEQNDQ